MTLLLNVKDEDATGSFHVKYYFDQNTNSITESKLYELNNNSYQNVILNIDLSTFEPSDTIHCINIYAVDNLEKTSPEKIYCFKYIKNKPKIILNKGIKIPLTFNVDKYIPINIEYKDERRSGKFKLIKEIYNEDRNLISNQNSSLYNVGDEKPVEISVNISTLNYDTNYYINITAINSHDEESNTLTIQFIISLSTPNLTITNQPKSTYFLNKDNNISLSGHLSDINLGNVSLHYKFDDFVFKQFHSIKIDDIDEDENFNCEIPISSELLKGNNNITIKAIDSFNKDNLATFSFSIEFSQPEIVEFNVIRDSNVYRYNIDTVIPINISFVDYTGAVNLSIKYQIADEIKSVKEIKITNTNIYTSTINIPIPKLTEIDHNLLVFLEDEYRMISYKRSYNFSFKFNEPIISATVSKNVFYRNKDLDIIIDYNITDIDVSGLVKIYIILDSSKDDPFNMTIDSFSILHYSFTFPNNFNEGDHKFEIYCINSNNKESNIIIIDFTYKFNAPVLNIREQPKSDYNLYQNLTLSISGTVKDLDCLGSVIVIILLNNHNIKNETIKIKNDSEHIFTSSIPININDQFQEGSNEIIISSVDDTGKRSNSFVFTFNLIYPPPYTTLDEITNYRFYRLYNRSIPI
ncbi:hypothetical protein TVAG_130420 [Trichomonas vaginalis G3]|uniref:Uncharacterized protein n=1 Tax=Trichomonas vaginalis (strain ATCC PRA-98 / G3) TaxID=412133 RepID=A2G8Z2_TRIV3|nr:hypothetical protein TVAGG3_0665380 [Trichomonas vaginalis G3]EAX86372.1 hypothetical protein TVAG_130420 [Trichomonas vaginalis G3]KAI5506797.1 hypothetical protein TVAGG3_0665380 [Trichomonas vaginalis G3]|eukprot:XP_001299302.1 hypothetical protein [Trichomonas vaginalis G3]